jgi:hypothetical protein
VVWPREKYARGENTKINYGVDTRGKKKKRTSKKNVDGRCTSSHENKTFRSRSVVKQRGIVFGFRKTATAGKIVRYNVSSKVVSVHDSKPCGRMEV